jgi:hypothetical protein
MAKAKKVEGGSATVSLGVTIPATPQFAGTRFDSGFTLPIQPGETPDQAHDRVREKTFEKLMQDVDALYGQMNDKICSVLNRGKTPGR